MREGGFTSIVFGRCFLSWCSTKERWGTFQRLYGFITVDVDVACCECDPVSENTALHKRLYFTEGKAKALAEGAD